ncbi:MAG TPA: hypothetical protein VGP02_07045 [Mycobacteriales bacterium]|jgi:hypothetical protein|nr:hypothetical protein [Mycobacteriales bacterium]
MVEPRWTCPECGASFPVPDGPPAVCPAHTAPDPEAGGSPSPAEDPELECLAEVELERLGEAGA